MCDVNNCTEKPIGELVKEFDGDQVVIKFCKKHNTNYHKTDMIKNSWMSYASIASCVCMMGVCSQALV